MICFFLPIFTNINYWYKLVTFFLSFRTQTEKSTRSTRLNQQSKLRTDTITQKDYHYCSKLTKRNNVENNEILWRELVPSLCRQRNFLLVDVAKKNLFKKKEIRFEFVIPSFIKFCVFVRRLEVRQKNQLAGNHVISALLWWWDGNQMTGK